MNTTTAASQPIPADAVQPARALPTRTSAAVVGDRRRGGRARGRRAHRRVRDRRALPDRRGRRGRHRLRAARLQGRRRRACSARTTSPPSSSSSCSPCSPSGPGWGCSPAAACRSRWSASSRSSASGSSRCSACRRPSSLHRSCPPRSRRSSGSRCSRCCSRPRRRAGVPATAATGRRPFLARALGLGALAVVGGGIGRSMVEGRASQVAAADTEIPQPVQPVSAPGPESSFDVAGITPLIVPNGDFYRIDTALVTPSVNLATWNLRVHGMVDTEVTLTFDQLVELPLIEQYVTIACVSNEVGGNLVGNAKWTGVRLTDVLEMAGVHAEATQIVPRSVDGWTAGFPTAWVTAPEPRPRGDDRREDERRAAARAARLPRPPHRPRAVRLRVRDEVAVRHRAHDARGVRRLLGAAGLGQGGADPDPVADRRAGLERRASSAGPVAVAGVAWAPDRGISRVEVQVDDGEWQNATIATPIGPQTWVQWKLAVAGDAGRARDRRPRDRRRGRGPDRPGHAAGPRRRPRLPHRSRVRVA